MVGSDLAQRQHLLRLLRFVMFFWKSLEDVMADKPFRQASKGVGIAKVLTIAEERKLLRCLSKRDRELVRFLLATGARISEALGVKADDISQMGFDRKLKKSTPYTPIRYYAIRLYGKGRKIRTVYYDRPIDFSDRGSRMAITNRIRRAARRAIGRTLSAHCMRHTFATRMIADGKSLTAVSRYLGHSSVAITGDLYVHDDLGWEDVR
jgi:integrase/recombinase XerD